MQRIKKMTAIIMCMLILSSTIVFGSTVSAGAKGTGAGLAEWALNAYNSGWSYVYGGSSPGAVDCSGLIYSYCGGERCGNPQLNTATQRGNVSSGIPRVHGLGLWRPGHVGVYVGDGMEVDARNDDSDMCYQSVSSAYMAWTYWFKLAACTYINNGWEKFNGSYYYYENGQYIINTSRTIGGVTYSFNSKGKSNKTPANMSSQASGSSSSSSSSKSSSSSQTVKQTSWRNGSTGSEVTKIQKRLTELGYYTGSIDGSFGDGTEKAYRAFQKDAGLTVDGIAGSDRNVLYSDNAPKAKSSSTEKAEETTQPTTVEPTTEPATEETVPEETKANEWKNGDENDTVKSIQEQLAKLGYFDVDPTGLFGDYTVQCVMNFQVANNIEATGVVDEATYNALFSEEAISNPNPTQETTDDTQNSDKTSNQVELSGPVMMPEVVSPCEYIVTNEKNQNYTDTASEVVTKTNVVTKKALSNSSAVIPAATTAKVKRSANIWLWFVLVAGILGALAIVFVMKDKKTAKYSKSVARKKKRTSSKSNINERW